MLYHSFKEIVAKCRENPVKKNIAVVCAEDEHTLGAVMLAFQDGLIRPILIGKAGRIAQLLEQYGDAANECRIIEASSMEASVQAMLELIHKGEADAIMKGLIPTADLMGAVVRKENGLRTEGIMSHLAFKELPNYHKLVGITDVALVTYPDLEQKKQLIANAAATFRKLGYAEPKIAVLAAIEAVNPKMPETLEAAELKRLNQNGEITGCLIEGPISYDLALSRETVAIKDYQSAVAADADILLVPNITAGNVLIKCLEITAGARGGGFVVGAKVPIVLTSRASDTYDKYYSLATLAALEERE